MQRSLITGMTTGTGSLDRLADLAASVLRAPVTQVSVFAENQVVIAGSGTGAASVGSLWAIDGTVCGVAARAGTTLVLTDARLDPRTADLPPVVDGMVTAYLGVPLLDESGEPVGSFCVFDPLPRSWSPADVELIEQIAATALRELQSVARAQLHERDRVRGELALLTSDAGTWEWDLATGAMTWDERMLTIYGYDQGPERFDGTAAAAARRRHPDDVEFITGSLARAIAELGTFEGAYRIVRPDGEIRWVETRGRVLPDDAGHPARIIGVTWDVTRSRSEQARRAALVAEMPVGFQAFDADWTFREINGEAARLIGRDSAEVLGANLWELFPAALGTPFETVFRRVAAGRVAETFEAFYPERLNRWYELRVVPGDDGGIQVFFLDVTDRHLAREQAESAAELARSHAHLAAFAGQIGHDLRTPLTAIVGFSELFLDGVAEGEDDADRLATATEFLRRTGASARRMRQTLDQLLAYAAVGGTLHRRPTSLDALMTPVVEDLRGALEGARISWGDGRLDCDPVQLRCLLQNLIGNALKYRHPDRPCTIEVEVRPDRQGGGGEALVIRDNGTGIPPHRRTEMLLPLSRLRTDVAGTGLGLAICARIADAHGGSLHLGDTPGGGTTVTVVVPAGPAAADAG